MADENSKKKTVSSILIIAVIIVAALIVVFVINSTEPTAQREAATKKTAMLVEVEQVRRGTYFPKIEGLGSVEAAEDITLNPRVDGRIVEVDENFIPGGFVEAGQILVKIDPADFENNVQQMESALAQARSELDVELGRRNVAKKEYEMLGRDLGVENKSLVLREPQLVAARAAVKSAQSMLNQAKLELERTSVVVPFDAQILSRDVNLGSEVDTNTEIARLVGVNEYWIIATVPLSLVERIEFPKTGERGAEVMVRNRSAWPDGEMRQGYVKRLIGALDNQTRLARVLISVEDPLGLEREDDVPQLLVGSIVQAEIKGEPLDGVFRINRDYLREGDRVWLKRDGKLVISDARVVLKDKEYAYIADGMQDDDFIVTSNLSTVAEGVDIRTEDEEQSDEAEEAQE